MAAIDNHRLLVDCRAMVLPCTGREPSRLTLGHTPLIRIELQQLVRALTHLALLIKHEATAEGVDLSAESDG